MPVNDAEEAGVGGENFRLQCKSNTCEKKKHWVGRISGCSGTLRKSWSGQLRDSEQRFPYIGITWL